MNSQEPKIGQTEKTASRSFDFPILSFFTGAGFLDMGFRNAGFSGIWHNEYSKDFVRGFEFGMNSMGATGSDAVIQSTNSIVDVGPNEVMRSAFGVGGRPSCFGMIGGPPCPDFSVGGKNRGSNGENGRLTEVYARRIVEIEPTFFLLENVPGLLRTRKHREFLTTVVERLSEAYLLDMRILNSLQFSVPQDRERVFLIGLQKKWLARNGFEDLRARCADDLISNARIAGYSKSRGATNHWFPWESLQTHRNPKVDFSWPTTDDFGSYPVKPAAPQELMVGPALTNGPDVLSLPNGNEFFIPYSDKFKAIKEGDVSRKSFKRLHRWRYSPAAAYGNNEVHLHPWEPRRLSVREAMRIQSVPDEYSLPKEMTLSSKFKTIGNGVPVKLAHAVAMTIKTILEEVQDGRFRPYS